MNAWVDFGDESVGTWELEIVRTLAYLRPLAPWVVSRAY